MGGLQCAWLPITGATYGVRGKVPGLHVSHQSANRWPWPLVCCAGVHVPVAWSDVRPSDEDFQAAFAAVRLRSHRLVDFVRARRGVLRSLVLCHSEGFWGDDGEFVPLASKHDFSLGTLGILLGLVADKLTGAQCCCDALCCDALPATVLWCGVSRLELKLSSARLCVILPARVYSVELPPPSTPPPLGVAALKMDRCNDLFAGGSPISTIAMLRSVAAGSIGLGGRPVPCSCAPISLRVRAQRLVLSSLFQAYQSVNMPTLASR